MESGREYELRITGGIQSYNGVAAGDDVVKTLTAADSDAVPPAPVADVTSYAAGDQLHLQWKDPSDPDFDHVTVSWRKTGDTQLLGTMTVRKGTQWAKLEGLTAGTSYDMEIRSVDGDGNEAELRHTAGTAAEAQADFLPPAPVMSLTVRPKSRAFEVSWSDSLSADFAKAEIRWGSPERKRCLVRRKYRQEGEPIPSRA
ncbi:fibronectin type III domain-containing protein [Paenibacillus sp. CC-CFT747]|nr:fibronectin type III domain-containing protein [Paenibacillus sp. CC-CFT747]